MGKKVFNFGIIHCGGCEKPIAYFPPDTTIKDVELYCSNCAIELELEMNVGEENGKN